MSYLPGQLLFAFLLSASWATARAVEMHADEVDPCSHGVDVWIAFQDSIRLAGGAAQHFSRTFTWVGRHFSGLDTYCGETLPAAKDFFQQRVDDMNCSPSQRASLFQLARDTGFWCQSGRGKVNPDIQYVIDWINDHEEDDDLISIHHDCDFFRAVIDWINGHEDDETTGAGEVEESSCPGRQLKRSCLFTALDAAGWTAERRGSQDTAPIQQLSHDMLTIVNTRTECMVTGARDGCPSWRRDILQTLFNDQTLSMPTVLGVNMTFNRQQLVDMFQLNESPRDEVDEPAPDDVIML